MADTNGTTTPASYNWESLVAAVGSSVAAVALVVWPTSSIPGAVQTAAVAIAGLLVALHIHVPKLVTHLYSRVQSVKITPAESALLDAAKKVLAEQKVSG